MNNKEVLKMCECAIFIALAVVIDIAMEAIPFLNMPNGGHISLAGLVLAIMSFRNGFKFGIIGCIIYGIVSFLIDPHSTNILSILFDYVFAFGVFGICGLFPKVFNKINVLNVVIFIALLCFCHVVRFASSTYSGVIVWDTKWGASAIYNAPYVFASLGVAIVVGLSLLPLLNKFNRIEEA